MLAGSLPSGWTGAATEEEESRTKKHTYLPSIHISFYESLDAFIIHSSQDGEHLSDGESDSTEPCPIHRSASAQLVPKSINLPLSAH